MARARDTDLHRSATTMATSGGPCPRRVDGLRNHVTAGCPHSPFDLCPHGLPLRVSPGFAPGSPARRRLDHRCLSAIAERAADVGQMTLRGVDAATTGVFRCRRPSATGEAGQSPALT